VGKSCTKSIGLEGGIASAHPNFVRFNWTKTRKRKKYFYQERNPCIARSQHSVEPYEIYISHWKLSLNLSTSNLRICIHGAEGYQRYDKQRRHEADQQHDANDIREYPDVSEDNCW